MKHPSTSRELTKRRRDYENGYKRLREFLEHSGLLYLKDLHPAHVEAWVKKMQLDGLSFNTRRLALLWVKRAGQMAPREIGKPDPLDGCILDIREEPMAEVEIYTLEDLTTIHKHLAALSDPRPVAAFGLMALMGLRPSEAIRTRREELKDGVIRTGWKTRASKRFLPVPEIVLQALEACPKSDFLLSTTNGKQFHETSLPHWWKDIPPPEGFESRWLAPKTMRKAFASMCIWELDLDERIVEAYLGRNVPGITTTTATHYLSRPRVEKLRPVSKAVNEKFAHSPAHSVEKP